MCFQRFSCNVIDLDQLRPRSREIFAEMRHGMLSDAWFFLVVGMSTLDPFKAVALYLWLALQLIVLIRFGLLPVILASVFAVWQVVGLTLDPGSWFFGRALLVVLVLEALALYGFWISLGGRPLIRSDVLEGS